MSEPPRFAFGRNWRGFLEAVDEARVAEAERSLAEWLGPGGLAGRSFLDIGCGSGLFSLAAVRLGAARVHSFDYDKDSVATTTELRRRFADAATNWRIERGDVLDGSYMERVGQFDVVYSWGVLHHTGAMWPALGMAGQAVSPGGRLFVAIYNDQGWPSVAWGWIKRLSARLPRALQPVYAVLIMAPREALSVVAHVLRGQPRGYVRTWTRYQALRGMSRWHDLLDWVGGHPFEVARPEEIVDYYRTRGFTPDRMLTCGRGLGCNQFLLHRDDG